MKYISFIHRAFLLFLAFIFMTYAAPAYADTFLWSNWMWHAGARWWFNDSLIFWAPLDDPSNPLKINKSAAGTTALTFTRATSATETSIDNGYITTVPSGTLRIESNGALIEGQRTNLFTYSDASQITDYGTRGNITVAPYSWPVGLLQNATTFADNAATRYAYQSFTQDNGTVYIASAYIVMDDGSEPQYGEGVATATRDFDILIDGSSATYLVSKVNVFDNVWRCSAKITGMHGGTRTAGIVKFTSNSTKGFKASGIQVEAASFPSSYIPTTTAAVTRNADTLTFPIAGNVSQTDFTAAFEVVRPALSTSANPATVSGLGIGTYNSDASIVVGKTAGSANIMLANFGSTWSGSLAGWGAETVGTLYKGAFRMSSSGAEIAGFRNGGNKLTTAVSPLKSSAWTGSVVAVGCKPLSCSPDQTLNIKNIKIWNRAFTDAEMVSITQ